ncbi:MAG: hypothetical protein JWQ81_6035 [Amycolatopsis sp.]|uniref:hypothetical protein n=1 Tax=Amycolatopsis sp. TaxID=37632 RepID=UPI002625355A|nr:hypothetical protein [Amycolatopsis sp.]MCU1685296.1 hypothetical protein [Amycolatopsis sp.]
MAAEEIQGLTARMDGLVREQSERRALLEQHGETIKKSSHEYMTKQVQAAERYVQHRRELGKRAKEAAEAPAPEVAEHDFEPEGHKAENDAFTAPPAPFTSGPPVIPERVERIERPASPRRARHRSTDEDTEEDDAFLNNTWRD